MPTMMPLVLAGLAVAFAAFLLVVGVARRRNADADLGGDVSLHDAAEAAFDELDRSGSPLAAIARACVGGAVGWFEDNLRKIVPGAGDGRISRKQLRDYLSWARSVQ